MVRDEDLACVIRKDDFEAIVRFIELLLKYQDEEIKILGYDILNVLKKQSFLTFSYI